MANQILAGAVINAGMVIAGVDADNPPFQAPLISISGWTIVAGSVSQPTSGTFAWTRSVGSGWVAGHEIPNLTAGVKYSISYEMRKTGGPGPVEMRITPAVGGGATLTNQITESSDFVTFTSTWTQPDQTTAYVNIISDNEGGSGEIRSISIAEVNNAPVVTGIQPAYTLTQGQDTVITAAATDPEGDAITWSYDIAGETIDMTVSQTDNVFTITPGTTDISTQVTFTATDSAGNSTSTTSNFDFTYVNQAPVVSGIQSAYTLTQGQDTVITATGTDPEGDAITWSFEEVIGSGDGYVAVSSFGDDDTGTNTGAVYIYNTNDLSAQPVKLVSTESTDNGRMGETDITFGAGKVIVGARRDAGSTGAVYIYDLSDLSAAPTRLAGPSSEGRFGNSVAVHSTNLIVGASWDNSVRRRSGRVYIYDLNDLSASPTTMIPDGVREYAYYGSSVTISGDLLFISSPNANSNGGAVYVYNANDFSLIQKLSSPSPNMSDNFGGDNNSPNAISVSGNNLIIGSTGHNNYKGSVYVFALDDLSATPTELMPYDGSAYNYFGACVASTSEYIIVGSYGNSAIATSGGAVYIYDINDLSAQPTKINTPVSTQYYSFGKTLSAIEDRIFVGAPNYDTHVYNTSDFSLIQTLPKSADVVIGDGFAQTVVAHTIPAVSTLNGTTVSQSDNVLTVTPGSEVTSFSMRFTATDSEGNVTATTSAFTVELDPNAFAVTAQNGKYYIDGQEAPTLTLTRGETYTFNVDATGHPLFFHDSVYWASGAYANELGSFHGVTGSRTETITYTVRANAPNTIWYNCGVHFGMGGTFNIVD